MTNIYSISLGKKQSSYIMADENIIDLNLS